MGRTAKISLVLLLIPLAIVALVTPFILRPAVLYWAKHKAHKTFAALTPSELRALDAIPVAIHLPTTKPSDQSLESLDVRSLNGEPFRIQFPVPRSRELKDRSLHLAYPQFDVRFMPPRSTVSDDAEAQGLGHKNFFDLKSEIYHTRLADIDAAPDFASLEHRLVMLAQKLTRLALWAYFTEFQEPDRRGFIMTEEANLHHLFCEISFPLTQSGCGIHFISASGVGPSDVEEFLATIQIAPRATLTSTTNPASMQAEN